MQKQEFTEYCNKAGLPVKLAGGVVMLLYDAEKKDEQVSLFQELMAHTGFNASFGWEEAKPEKGAEKHV